MCHQVCLEIQTCFTPLFHFKTQAISTAVASNFLVQLFSHASM